MKRSREKYGGEPAGRQTCLPFVLDQTGRDTQSDDNDGICSNSLSIARPRLALLALLIVAATLASVVRISPLSAYSLSRRYYHSNEEQSQLGGDWNTSSRSTIVNINRGKEQIFIDEIDEIFPADDKYTTKIQDHIRLIYRRLQEESTSICVEPSTWVNKVPAPVLYCIIAVLVLFSAFFSGLTLALMGLDTSDLEIVMSGDDPALARAAERIHPLRKDGNLLLCTLLLGNVAVNTLLGILMADLTSGTVGFISSTALIVIFGEIIPQASFSRYALQVGEKAVPIMKVIIALLYILAKPLAFCLDKVLGYEIGTTYSKKELSKLLEMHVDTGQINTEEGKAMRGALQYQDMTVREVMTPIGNTFMLNVENKLNFETMATIFKTGYSRIPVYEDVCTNIIGMLFVKDLIFINPVDETPVRNFVQIFGRGANVVWIDDNLGEVLSTLKRGQCHLALVKDINKGDDEQDPFYEVKGIITLEDIIEIILGDQIVDETDTWVDAEHTTRVKRTNDFVWANLRLLDAKIVDQTLSDDELRAVSAHLSSNFASIFDRLSEKQLLRMIAATPVVEIDTAEKEVNEFLPSDLMYEKNSPSDKCTFILGGKVTVIAGNDNFRSDVSSWSLLASGALIDSVYSPDFSAYVSSGPCRCLQFTRDIFDAAAASSVLEMLPPAEVDNEMKLKSISEAGNVTHGLDRTGQSARMNGKGNEDVVKLRGELLQKLLSTRHIDEQIAAGDSIGKVDDNVDDGEPPL
uniref:CNNM transmembrane domain-containing protein n=1 Tax=Chaetoceros debilis TaxID=122233 RepID=A0A7S3PYU5_9STRA|mmetsp:Transcript_5384/g.8003  ORF Transcript_5384/g.8003 Transcript_5384/m.8003 type:complete len:748 (-) Transcript_5384:112-2355(-)